MKLKQLTTSIALATAVLASGTAFAAGPTNAEYYAFQEIMSMKMIDKNKDGMVSKKEFMDMMTMAWEMNAKKMGTKGEMMSDAQFKEFLMYLKAGG
ncbi:MAG TPA: EF-hand domain-containing protein [Ramlibacter sp.]|nr:EF-hand domain-containing protein [Ramlibacter sp.]